MAGVGIRAGFHRPALGFDSRPRTMETPKRRGRPERIEWDTVARYWGRIDLDELSVLVGCSTKYLKAEGSRRFGAGRKPVRVEIRCAGCLGRYKATYANPAPCPYCETPHERAA